MVTHTPFRDWCIYHNNVISVLVLQVLSYPSSSDVSNTHSELSEKIFFFTANRETQQMSGYRVLLTPSKELLPTELVWTLQFPADSERIISTISKSPNGRNRYAFSRTLNYV